ncbi:uncharacterized protein FIBRA_05429 [Fibroporia radiculosa]|uniref:RRM domain-containing protein n=1 Tax=Fibroporia radiculosa TaxID=599839 RepID=J4IAQ1_9APHY|nr:uncharacterized protein FIBRA_05429 [Fibroporia radiculosa]CCM03301.1 predicted protein [Fibroporia radiculosa]
MHSVVGKDTGANMTVFGYKAQLQTPNEIINPRLRQFVSFPPFINPRPRQTSSYIEMDKTLDEIIATRPKIVRRRPSAKQQVLGNPAAAPATRARAAASKAAAAPVATQQQPADKIIVSNLPNDVNEVQIKELFHTTVGPLRDVTLHYDSQGRSKGVAAVHFQRRGDVSTAFPLFHTLVVRLAWLPVVSLVEVL